MDNCSPFSSLFKCYVTTIFCVFPLRMSQLLWSGLDFLAIDVPLILTVSTTLFYFLPHPQCSIYSHCFFFSFLTWYCLVHFTNPHKVAKWLTDCLEHSPWEASHLASQISCLVWNLKVHCSVTRACTPPVPVNHIIPIHIIKLYFFLQHNLCYIWVNWLCFSRCVNVILPSIPTSPKWSLSFKFSD